MKNLRPKVARVAIDPVCGKRFNTDQGIALEVRGEVRWFCGAGCARRFQAKPWRYEDEEYADRS